MVSVIARVVILRLMKTGCFRQTEIIVVSSSRQGTADL